MLDTQDAARRLYRCRRLRGGILDCRCARRSANQQVGTKGWSCPIEQRDANFDLSSAGPPPMTDLLNLAHTTRAPHAPRRHSILSQPEPLGDTRSTIRTAETAGVPRSGLVQGSLCRPPNYAERF